MSSDAEKDNSSRTSRSDLEDCPLTGEERRLSFKRRRHCKLTWPANDSLFWKLSSVFLTVFSLMLLIMQPHINIKNVDCHYHNDKTEISRVTEHMGSPESWSPDKLVETKFYRDVRYMTLEHEADYLWQEHLFMSTGNIRLPAEDGKGNGTLKSISMLDYS